MKGDCGQWSGKEVGTLWRVELLREVRCGRYLVKAGKLGKSKEMLECFFFLVYFFLY